MRHGAASAFVPRLGESGNFGTSGDLYSLSTIRLLTRPTPAALPMPAFCAASAATSAPAPAFDSAALTAPTAASCTHTMDVAFGPALASRDLFYLRALGGANDLCRRRKGDNDSGAISAATTAHAQPCAEEAVSRSMPTVCVKKDVPIVDEVTDIKREAAEYVASTSANAIHMDQDNQRAFETIAHPSALDQQRSQAAFVSTYPPPELCRFPPM